MIRGGGKECNLYVRVRAPMATIAFMASRDREEAARRLAVQAQYRKAAGPVLHALAEAGYPLDYITQLPELGVNYKAVVPLLIDWLPRVDDPTVKESIVRALTVRWAKGTASPALIEEFNAAPMSEVEGVGVKWAIGNALSVVADDRVFERLAAIAEDKRHGHDREMVALALGNMKNPHTVDVLVRLLDDDQVSGHAIMALGKLRAKSARGKVERFVQHPKAWIRREARKALKRMEDSP
jgi:hypothetical protein